jgi:hypothetical protein
LSLSVTLLAVIVIPTGPPQLAARKYLPGVLIVSPQVTAVGRPGTLTFCPRLLFCPWLLSADPTAGNAKPTAA